MEREAAGGAAFFPLALQAKARLANWDEVAHAFAAALRHGLLVAPDDAELLAVQAAADPSLRAGDLGQYDCPDGQVFVWRSPDGPYQVSACLLTVPRRRPDLQQITFVPRSIEPAHMDTDAAEGPSLWHGPILAGMLTCGLCGHLLTSERPAAYSCPTGCLPELDSEELELRIAQEAIPRAFPPSAIRKLALAQEILTAAGVDMALNVSISAQHALSQWRSSMTTAQRRGLLDLAFTSVTVSPGTGLADDSPAVDLAFSWREQS
ncbi:hypothetical protein [Streptomyces sp. NBC_01643]|uniref:hypothetical protein n=1 Tax=Streptomyces sp. NBC_01643 TaxID=2975906 RepID=UPI003870A3AC|nr:hypothetical protein OHB03_44220 [Streptomyces sp. NBC_01643]